MGKQTKETHTQFEVLVDFMEKNGDLCQTPPGPQGRLKNLQKWIELSDLLNKAIGDVKPLEKWRKTWSDFKNNTKKKIEKIRKQGGAGSKLTDIEKRVLRLVEENRSKTRPRQYITRASSENVDEMVFKEDVSSLELRSDECSKSFTPPRSYFCSVDGKASKRRRDTSSCSESSTSSQSSEKRRKISVEENMREITDRFLQLERDKEKMAHEREMARLKQNDQLISVFGRIVNVLETLTPNIQRYLDRKANEDG